MKKKANGNEKTSEERANEKPISEEREFNPLPSLVNTKLAIQKQRVASEVRQTHLAKQGKRDAETDEVHRRLENLEDYVDGRIAEHIERHPAYPWFSRVKGAGNEVMGNVVGLIDIEKANTISSLWKFAGRAPEDGKAPKRQKGKKLSYNSQLRTMTWRLAVSILKAGLRQKCAECGHLFGSRHEECPKCSSTEFSQVAVSKYAACYLKEKGKYYERFTNQGNKIMPAPQGRVCPECGQEVKKKATKYCPVCGMRLTKKEEPKGVIWEGHLDNLARVKMIKLFLAHLWLTWREAEGLPVSKPYAIDIQRHSSFIGPWEMCDR